jgi:chemotaxis protein CheZ
MSAIASHLSGDNLPPELHALLNSADGPAFEQALDALVRQREQHTFRALGVLARDLHGAIRRLGGDLVQDGSGSIADARKHLQDALDMSGAAAHRCIDFADRMRPEAEALAQNAGEMLAWLKEGDATAVLARQAADFATRCDAGLTDMVVAQSWQDLSGQRIKKVVNFIESVESSLLDLVRITGALAGGETPEAVAKVNSQDEADRLLSEFGF